MKYSEALDYLNNFVNYEKVVPTSAEQFNLERVRRFLKMLDNPQLSYPSIVIAGTKGKGSTAFLIASVLESAGYRTGLYSQPHLRDFRERFQINRQLISENALADLVAEIRPLVEQYQEKSAAEWGNLTAYEVTTALALLYFARQAIDFAVLEIGLGGRLDAVNVVEPLVSVITSISYDHMAILGDTLDKIAREKAGIIKPGTPVITVPQPPATLEVIREVSARQNAPLLIATTARQLSEENPLSAANRYRASQEVAVDFGGQAVNAKLGLLGEHQRLNAGAAAAALWQQQQQKGLPISLEALQAGFARQSFQGRLQIVQAAENKPLVVADAAHNAESAARLREALTENFYYAKVRFVVGLYQDKDISGFLAELTQTPRLAEIIFTRSQNPRCSDPQTLREIAQTYVGVAVQFSLAADVPTAFGQALQNSDPADLICVTGSFSVVGELLIGEE